MTVKRAISLAIVTFRPSSVVRSVAHFVSIWGIFQNCQNFEYLSNHSNFASAATTARKSVLDNIVGLGNRLTPLSKSASTIFWPIKVLSRAPSAREVLES